MLLTNDNMARLARECPLRSLVNVNLYVRKPFGKVPWASYLLKLVWFDICRHMNMKAHNDAFHFITFIYDYSHFS